MTRARVQQDVGGVKSAHADQTHSEPADAQTRLALSWDVTSFYQPPPKTGGDNVLAHVFVPPDRFEETIAK